jgi:hypothetical protein
MLNVVLIKIKQKFYHEAISLCHRLIQDKPEFAHLYKGWIAIAKNKIKADQDKSLEGNVHIYPLIELETDLPKEIDLFDAEWYTNNYDLESLIDPIVHYKTLGWKKYYDPSMFFSTKAYLDTEQGLEEYFDSTGQDPLQHFCLTGFNENRDIFFNPLAPISKRYMPTSELVTFENVSTKSTVLNLGAFVHCYYPDLAIRIIKECLALDLEVHAALIEGTDYNSVVSSFGNKINYKLFSNRGRDIGPFVTAYKDEIVKYDYCIHLHTKKSLHYGFERSDWLSYCLESLLSNLIIVKKIFESDPDVSIVFPDPPEFLRNQINWGHNFNRISHILSNLGLDLKLTQKLDFPVGSMFWFDPKKIYKLFDLCSSQYFFEKEAGQVDGTLAHAFERLFGVYSLLQGYKIIPIRKNNSDLIDFNLKSSGLPDEQINQISGEENAEYNYALKHFYPELTPFKFSISKNSKKRLNILVPTVDPKHVFGGIQTALDLFSLFVKEFDVESRIITTDGVTDVLITKNFNGYSLYNLEYSADDDPLQLLSGVPRDPGALIIRENDIFIATAWWTASHLQKIENFQKLHYKWSPKHIYLIQDFEPHFYGWSSKTLLALDTYKSDWIHIYNTNLLKDYFASKKLSSSTSYSLKPELNFKIKSCLKKLNKTQKEKIVLIYGRPFAERNCNEILLESISLWRSMESSSNWKIISLGQNYDHSILEFLGIEVLGKVDLEIYSSLLAKSYMGVSLMVSPHPSYPPYEMLAAGLLVYSNIYESKRILSTLSNIYMGNGSPDEIADFLNSKALSFQDDLLYDSEIIESVEISGDYLLKDIAVKINLFENSLKSKVD